MVGCSQRTTDLSSVIADLCGSVSCPTAGSTSAKGQCCQLCAHWALCHVVAGLSSGSGSVGRPNTCEREFRASSPRRDDGPLRATLVAAAAAIYQAGRHLPVQYAHHTENSHQGRCERLTVTVRNEPRLLAWPVRVPDAQPRRVRTGSCSMCSSCRGCHGPGSGPVCGGPGPPAPADSEVPSGSLRLTVPGTEAARVLRWA